MLWLAVVGIVLSLNLISAVELNDSPVIGILTTPVKESPCEAFVSITEMPEEYSKGSCFNSYYVKWLEQGGARIVPIKYDASIEELDVIFSSINGLLYTGGELSLLPETLYYQNAHYLFEKALNSTKHGDYFPVWGTCMGFQLLSIMAAQNYGVLDHNVYKSEKISLPLIFTSNTAGSRMLKDIPDDIALSLSTMNITENLHHDGVTPDTFAKDPLLSQFYNVLSVNYDLNGRPFVSTVEAKDYPVYGVQWHPERPQFEWYENMGLVHSLESAKAMEYFANFFVEECRKNSHHFVSKDVEDKTLIYNYNPVYVGHGGQTIYFFNEDNNNSDNTSVPREELNVKIL